MTILEEARERRFLEFEKDMFEFTGAYPPTVVLKKDIWQEFAKDTQVQDIAVKVTKNRFEEDSYRNIYMIYAMLRNYDDIDEKTYYQLASDIIASKELSFLKASGDEPLISAALSNTELRLAPQQKSSIIGTTYDCIINSSYRSTYDLRYRILKNKYFTDTDKKILIDDLYDEEEYEEFLDDLSWDVVNESIDESGDPRIKIDDILFEELDKNDEDLKPLVDQTMFIRKLVSFRKPAWLKNNNEPFEKKIGTKN